MPTSSKKIHPALVVFGGTGFVGTAVLAEALEQNEKIQIFVVSRSGVEPKWLQSQQIFQTVRIGFLKGDLLAPQTVRDALKPIAEKYNIVGCISCVGAITPWSNKNMVRVCGDANINAYAISREIGANKFAVMTRDRSNMDDWWYPFPRLMPGYYKGKRKIEEFIENDIENKGNAICLRAGFVTGTRRTMPGLPTSLKLSVPMEYKILKHFCPTIDVKVLAAAAVRFVLSKRKAEAVLVTNDEILDYFKLEEPA